MNLAHARELMHEWVQNPALRVHMECVAACMGAYANKIEPAQLERWQVAGLLHDFDWERHPTPEEHPIVGSQHLQTLGVDDEIRAAILGHCADRTGIPRISPMAKALFACDELSGFIVACAKVRPEGISTLEAKSVQKKLKDKAFAANVSREDITQGAAELQPLTAMDPVAHIQFCIDAIRIAKLP